MNISLPKLHKYTALVLLTIISGGCATHTPRSPAPPIQPQTELQDGPPKEIQDISIIPNAIPKVEPRARYGNHSPYEVFGKTYHVMKSANGYKEDGIGSWYGEKFSGRKTSSFEPYDPYAMTAAHKSLPLPTYVRVTNLENNREVIVKVNDRGPFHEGRIIDLSYAAAAKLGYMEKGTAQVRVEVITPPTQDADDTVVTPLQPPPSDKIATAMPVTAATPTDPQSKPQIFLQVAAFSLLSAAQALEKRLTPNISAPVAINSSGDPRSQMHRVRVGPFKDEMTAILVSEQIKLQKMGDPLIIHR